MDDGGLWITRCQLRRHCQRRAPMMDDHLLDLALLVATDVDADAAINLRLLRLTAVLASSNIPSNAPPPPTPPDEKKLASSVNFDGGRGATTSAAADRPGRMEVWSVGSMGMGWWRLDLLLWRRNETGAEARMGG